MPAIAKKARLSVRNWREYNESLVARGSVTFWFSDETLQNWYHENGTGKRGRPFTYSDSTMELFLTIRELLRLPYRQTEGF
ncbi:MAG: transposase, partial [Pirellulales bacterium]